MRIRLPDPSASRAVLVGFPRYASGDFKDRPAIAANIDALARLLADEAVLGLPPEHIVITDETADFLTVLRVVDEAAFQATDTLLVYFAGHGFIDDGGELRMAVYESDRERAFLSLKYRDLREVVLKPRRAEFKVTVLDCCFSGAAAGLGGDGEEDFARQTVIAGTCVMTACSGTQIAYSPPGEQYTAYTGQLIAAVREGIERPEAFLTPQTLTGDVLRRLRARNLPEPTISSTAEGGSTPLFHNRRPAAPPPVVDPASLSRGEQDVWRYLDEVAVPALNGATNSSLLVSCFARLTADLLRADLVSVDQRTGADRFEPLGEFSGSDRKMHRPGLAPYSYPAEAVEAGRLRALAADDSVSHPQGHIWTVLRSVQIWRVGEGPERLRGDLGQSYSSWSELLIDRGLEYALAVPVFDAVGLWGQVLVGRLAASGPLVAADGPGIAYLACVFRSVLSGLDRGSGTGPRELSVEGLIAEARALRVALRAQRVSRSDGGGS